MDEKEGIFTELIRKCLDRGDHGGRSFFVSRFRDFQSIFPGLGLDYSIFSQKSRSSGILILRSSRSHPFWSGGAELALERCGCIHKRGIEYLGCHERHELFWRSEAGIFSAFEFESGEDSTDPGILKEAEDRRQYFIMANPDPENVDVSMTFTGTQFFGPLMGEGSAIKKAFDSAGPHRRKT